MYWAFSMAYTSAASSAASVHPYTPGSHTLAATSLIQCFPLWLTLAPCSYASWAPNGWDHSGHSSAGSEMLTHRLTAVSGVGPKVGLAILSVMEPQRVALAISAGDHKAFKAANGVGPKLAQRIVLELKDKVAKGFVDGISLEDVAGATSTAPAAQGAGQAIAALVSLGYSQSEAAMAVSKIDATLPVEEIIKLALRGMAGRR